MNTNINRIKKRILALSQFNRTPEQGVTRFSYSAEDKAAKAFLLAEMEQIGLSVTIDAVGNIRGRLRGQESGLAPVFAGSHLDTVLHGGRFDGIVGVVGALEAINVIAENHLLIKRPVEIIIFAEEEGSNFSSTMAGSKALVGRYSVEDLKHLSTPQGVSMYDMTKAFGLNPDELENFVLRAGDVQAMLELHIEQSVVLDNSGMTIGIVEAIYGSTCLSVNFFGVPNHAGATPMALRSDPMVAAASFIRDLTDFTLEKANDSTVCTVGKIQCIPNVTNIISGQVTLSIDIRDVDQSGINQVVKAASELARSSAEMWHVSYKMEKIAESPVIQLSPDITDTIERVAQSAGINYRRMNSGAVHDSAMLAQVTDVGMIFVPSVGGRSHVPEENTYFSDIHAGCELLLNTILELTI